jgi:actin-related protein
MNFNSFPLALNHHPDRLHNEIEEFLTTLFYHVLKTNPKDKSIVLCERLGGMRKLTEAITYVLFKKFDIKGVFSLMSNVLPLYATGVETGIVVDCGFQQVEIMPISNSQVCIEGFQICNAGGAAIEKNLSSLIREDN